MRTKENYDYSTISDRVFEHDGCICDLGCVSWDMFESLIGKKRIIGADPFAEERDGCEYYEGVITPFDSFSVFISNTYDDSANQFGGGDSTYVNGLSWKSFCRKYDIDKVSILKLNIEGAEYPLLNSMDSDDFAKIDQIMVSFHDWINPKWKHLTTASHCLLQENGFELAHTASQYGWRLYLKK